MTEKSIIKDGKHSNGMKELVALALERFFEYGTFVSDGYEDSNSSKVRDYLSEEFPEFTWEKNSSQNPFDIYSIDAKITLELKKMSPSGKVVFNATAYPDEVKVKDVVSKTLLGNESCCTSSEEFMDVLILLWEKDNTGKIINYKIVDGSYWNITYNDFVGCRDFFKQANSLLPKFLDDVSERFPDNSFINKCINNELPLITLKLRKLLEGRV